MLMFQNPEFWVAVGVLIFLGVLVLLKAPSSVTRALDERAGKISSALQEAEDLREEARRLLASLQAQRADAERQAGEMLNDARLEAERMAAEAKTKLEAQIARRTALADRRIAMAEERAADEVKAAAADLAAALAEQVLAQRLQGLTSDPLVDKAIGEMGRRLQ